MWLCDDEDTELLWRPCGAPTAEWFGRFWAFAARDDSTRAATLRSLCDGLPLLPTDEGLACPLSRQSRVIAPSPSLERYRSALRSAGCRVLHRAVRAAHLLDYVFAPTRAGVLAALDAALRSKEQLEPLSRECARELRELLSRPLGPNDHDACPLLQRLQ